MKMRRRELLKGAAAAALTAMVPQGNVLAEGPSESQTPTRTSASKANQQIVMLVYPQFNALDLVGPHAFLAGLMNADVHLVWKTKSAIATDGGATGGGNLTLVPSATFNDSPREPDVLFVPGGMAGTIAVMQDDETLAFLADRGGRARYVTSVCTGSLVLGAAGLLRGYRATSHWAFKDLLPLFGAIPTEGRVVEDRNRITGGGVTSGIDFGLALAARMRGKQYAEMLQLLNEYDPHPPFDAGTPAKAGPTMTRDLTQLMQPGLVAMRKVALAESKKITMRPTWSSRVES
jgi:cyclohexyl-isocyanide hydratase